MSAHSRQTSEPDRITRPQPAEVRKETYDSLDSLMEGEHEDWLGRIEAGEYSADIENELKQILAGIHTERYDPARVKADQEAQHAG